MRNVEQITKDLVRLVEELKRERVASREALVSSPELKIVAKQSALGAVGGTLLAMAVETMEDAGATDEQIRQAIEESLKVLLGKGA